MRKEYMWLLGGVAIGYLVLPKVMASFKKEETATK